MAVKNICERNSKDGAEDENLFHIFMVFRQKHMFLPFVKTCQTAYYQDRYAALWVGETNLGNLLGV